MERRKRKREGKKKREEAKKEIKPNEFMEKLEKYIHSKFDKLVVKI